MGKPQREPSASTWSTSKANAGPFCSSAGSNCSGASAFFFLPFDFTALLLGDGLAASALLSISAAVPAAADEAALAAVAAVAFGARRLGFLAGEARVGSAGSARVAKAEGTGFSSDARVVLAVAGAVCLDAPLSRPLPLVLHQTELSQDAWLSLTVHAHAVCTLYMQGEQVLKHSTTLVPFVHEASSGSDRLSTACTAEVRAMMDTCQYYSTVQLAELYCRTSVRTLVLIATLVMDLAFPMTTAEPHLLVLGDCKPGSADACIAAVTAAFFFLTGCLVLLQAGTAASAYCTHM